jgi:hypothetical protein
MHSEIETCLVLHKHQYVPTPLFFHVGLKKTIAIMILLSPETQPIV